MIAPFVGSRGQMNRDERVLVGADTRDDAGVFALGDRTLVATADFITPVCDDPYRYGRVAAANSLSDVWAMGGRPLFALNLCCFPEEVPREVCGEILRGAQSALLECGAALLGGHSVEDPELKFGLSVVGEVARERVLANTRAQVGQRLILTKPLGTGVMVNAFKFDKLDEVGLEPALVQMERLNAEAATLALAHGVTAATDITGFGLVGHALNLARGSNVIVRVRFEDLLVHDAFYPLVERGVSTGCTAANEKAAAPWFLDSAGLDPVRLEVLFDAQTSGGLLLATPAAQAPALLEALLASGHRAAEIGEIVAGPPRFEVV